MKKSLRIFLSEDRQGLILLILLDDLLIGSDVNGLLVVVNHHAWFGAVRLADVFAQGVIHGDQR